MEIFTLLETLEDISSDEAKQRMAELREKYIMDRASELETAEEKGEAGFGYDSLFVPEGYELTFAQLGEDIKNSCSHRARALKKLKEIL